MTGHRLVEHLRAHDRHGAWRAVVLAEEPRPAYNRVALSSYLEGRSAADLTLADRAFLTDPLVELRTAAPVTGIDRRARTVTTADGTVTRYDALVLATGSRPFVPPVPGRDLPGCFVYRTFDDLDALREAAREGLPGVVVGGGPARPGGRQRAAAARRPPPRRGTRAASDAGAARRRGSTCAHPARHRSRTAGALRHRRP
ncbi:FAD-dependent oxidoreductase [Streptomyces prasinosporus]